jgi:hypothetical protein
VEGGNHLVLCECVSHREGSTRCHIGCHDRDSSPYLRRVVEPELSLEIYILTRCESRALRSKEDVGVVELDIFVDTHRREG